MNEAIGSCVGLYLMIGAAALVVGVALTVGVHGHLRHSRRAARPGARGLRGHGRYRSRSGSSACCPKASCSRTTTSSLRNVVRIGAVLLRLALTIGLLTLNASLVVLAAVQLDLPAVRLHRLACS